MKFVGRSTDGERMEIMELEGKQRINSIQVFFSEKMKDLKCTH